MSGLSRKEQDAIIAQALVILEARLPRERFTIGSPGAAHRYAQLHLGQAEREIFMCLFVDAQHRVIAKENLFMGTLSQTSVHPREIARAALKHNAAAVVLVHNHPSGNARFSEADRLVTAQIRDALWLVDVSVLDHLLVAGEQLTSYALEERAAQERLEFQGALKDHQRRAKLSQAMRASWARRKGQRKGALQ